MDRMRVLNKVFWIELMDLIFGHKKPNGLKTLSTDIFHPAGVFPDRMKNFKVIPLFKNSNVHKFTNTWPISKLSQFTKTLEKRAVNAFCTPPSSFFSFSLEDPVGGLSCVFPSKSFSTPHSNTVPAYSFSYHHWQQLADMYSFYYGCAVFEQRPNKQVCSLKG